MLACHTEGQKHRQPVRVTSLSLSLSLTPPEFRCKKKMGLQGWRSPGVNAPGPLPLSDKTFLRHRERSEVTGDHMVEDPHIDES